MLRTRKRSPSPHACSNLCGCADFTQTGIKEDGPDQRYKKRFTVKSSDTEACDTIIIMECKLWVCKVIDLIVTARLDIRLSQLLYQYKQEYEYDGIWGNIAKTRKMVKSGTRSLSKSTKDLTKGMIALAGKASLQETKRKEAFNTIMKQLHFDERELVPILMDLLRYDHVQLVSESMGLLVRQFEQRKVLAEAGSKAFLLVKDQMVEMLNVFDGLLRRLSVLAARRRLFDQELYEAAAIMSKLSVYCYSPCEPTDDMPTATLEKANSRKFSSSRRTSAVDMIDGPGDHSQPCILEPVGCAEVIDINRIKLKQEDVSSAAGNGAAAPANILNVGSCLHINNHKYTVREATSGGCEVMLDRPLKASGLTWNEAGTTLPAHGEELHNQKLSEALVRKSEFTEDEWREFKIDGLQMCHHIRSGDKFFQPDDGALWVMREVQLGAPDTDMQMLLLKLGAHQHALRLLALPFEKARVNPRERELRLMLCAAYRLLNNMSTAFPLMQAQLAQHLDLFVSHTHANLVSHDASPTCCINTILQDNREACEKVTIETIRHFVHLAAKNKKPRFLRFLRMIIRPNGVVLPGNQQMVVEALAENRDSLLLFNNVKGVEEREALIRENDHIVHNDGRLSYHIELITLLGGICDGNNPNVISTVSEMLSLSDIHGHLLRPTLPKTLHSAYLSVLDMAYLSPERLPVSLSLAAEYAEEMMPALIKAMAGIVHDFVKQWLAVPTNFGENSDAAEEHTFVCDFVLPTMAHVFTSKLLSVTSVDMSQMAEPCQKFINVLGDFRDKTDDTFEVMASARRIALDLRSAMAAYCKNQKLDLQYTSSSPESEEWEDDGLAAGERTAVLIEQHRKGRFAFTSALSRKGSGTQSGTQSTRTRVRARAGIISKERSPQLYLPDFMKAWQDQFSAAKEFDDLVLIFSKELNSLQSHQAQDTTARRAQDLDINFLIQHLLVSRVAEGEELDPIRLKRSVSGMRVLLAMLDKFAASESKAEKKARRRLQCSLSEMGATRVALSMASSENDELCEAGLKLAIGLLRGGNKEVQNEIFSLINSELAEFDVYAFDGTENTLVLMVKKRLRIAVAEVREAKMYRRQQQDHLQELERPDVASALSPATVAAMRAELKKEFASRSHVKHVLKFLQLLCEGHHTQLQDFVRDQTTEMTSVRLRNTSIPDAIQIKH